MQLVQLPTPNIKARATQYADRTEGVHISGVMQDILIGMDPAKYGRDGSKEPPWALWYNGLIFEEMVEDLHAAAWRDKEIDHSPEEIIRPGEILVDGMLGTPDAFNLYKNVPQEYKSTKQSCRLPITDTKFWKYWVQLKAYAYMLGVDGGILWVWFINGNYSRDDNDPESGHVIKGWEATWTQQELTENWLMLRNHAIHRGWLVKLKNIYVPNPNLF